MNRRRRLSLAAALVTGALMTVGLTGCFGEPPAPSVTPSPTGFATNEEAYAAAEQAYRDYIDATNLRNEGRVGPDPAQYVTPAIAENLSENAAQRKAEGITITGRARILDIAIQSGDTERVLLQACLDQTSVRQIDSSGADVTPSDRANIPAMKYTFIRESNRMLMSDAVMIGESCLP